MISEEDARRMIGDMPGDILLENCKVCGLSRYTKTDKKCNGGNFHYFVEFKRENKK